MKKIIYRSLILIFLSLFIFAIYISTIGIKTDRFNNQISNEIKKINNQLDLNINKIVIFLDLFELRLSLKTVGANLQIRDKIIRFESITSYIDIKKLFNGQFFPTELNISTRSLEIKNLISFIRVIDNNTQLFILEKFVKKGHIIADIILKFDEQGDIKDNYAIKGFVKDIEIKSVNKLNLSKINFVFNFKKNLFDFKDVQLSLNNKDLFFPELNVKKEPNRFLITGKNNNKGISLSENEIYQFLDKDLIFPKINFVEFDLDNIFSFSINKKYKIKNLKVDSNLNLKRMTIFNI